MVRQKRSDSSPGPLVFLGPPGAGKGTQAREIVKQLGVPHISTGDMFRENAERKTPLGLKAKATMDSGGLVGDDVVNEMVQERISRDDCGRGFLLDGYPRTLAQAEALKGILKQKGSGAPVVIHLRLGYNTVVERLSGRRICPVCNRIYNLSLQPPAQPGICDADGASLQQRPDDREAAIRERLSAYETQTAPLIAFYRNEGRFYEVDADQAPGRITGAIHRILNAS
ncbi:MAG: adenylate kinase [Acidobacteria bacterium]|nr:adenylate kinase [Acidobacteriota bacterium]